MRGKGCTQRHRPKLKPGTRNSMECAQDASVMSVSGVSQTSGGAEQ